MIGDGKSANAYKSSPPGRKTGNCPCCRLFAQADYRSDMRHSHAWTLRRFRGVIQKITQNQLSTSALACSRQMTGRVTVRIVDKSRSVILRSQRPKLTRKIG